MKISITGATSGIGKAYFDACQARGFLIKQFSRSTGYDITCVKDQERIIDESSDCDIFINNAHDGFAQTELFSRSWLAWKNQPKIIICTGSHVTLRRSWISGSHHELGIAHYAAQKSALEMAINWAWTEDPTCHVVLVKPALTGTPRTNNMNSKLSSLIPIDPDDLANFVLDSVLNPSFKIREITMTPRKKYA
jgi:NAD(P)-dependent dehydrogenase (short-subunit alcohol dehydrogenase family)